MDNLLVDATYEHVRRLAERIGIPLTPCKWKLRTGKLIWSNHPLRAVAWVTLADGHRLIRLRLGPHSRPQFAPRRDRPPSAELVFGHMTPWRALHELSAAAGSFGEPTKVLLRHPDRLGVIADWLADHGHPDAWVRKLAAMLTPDTRPAADTTPPTPRRRAAPPKRASRGRFPRLAVLPDPCSLTCPGSERPSLPLPPPDPSQFRVHPGT